MFNDPPPEPSPFPHGPDGPQGPRKDGGGNNPGNGGSGGQGGQGGGGNPGGPGKVPASFSARVPERVASGVMATGSLIIHGQQELIIDFVQAMGKPVLAARVVVTPAAAEQMLAAMQENYNRYVGSFGTPPAMPKNPPGERPKTLQEIYDEIKIDDHMLSGAYANGVMVRHSPGEFNIDFITGFYPHTSVSSRVYMAAPRMAQFLENLQMAIAQQRKNNELSRQQNPGSGS